MNQPFHPEKGPFLRDLQPGDRLIGFYVLRNKQLEPFRDPARGVFLTLTLGDRSGQAIARIWENAEGTAADLQTRSVIKVDGEMETYLDRKQVRVLRVRNAREDEYDLRDMLPTSGRDPASTLAELREHAGRIDNPHLQGLVNHFFNNEGFAARFAQAPAARSIHHAYLGGLIEHSLEILQICNTVLDIYPQIDGDLLRAGALLHDIGKLREFSWDFDIDYTDEGRLLGHIMITDEMITDALASMPDFPPELALRLRHMLLAHHGRLEYGSPRRPQTLEAITLHHIENLDAQVNRFHLLLERADPAETWTQYNRLLGRQLYLGGQEDLSAEEQGLAE
jgi:3'-5' exoribonuclease